MNTHKMSVYAYRKKLGDKVEVFLKRLIYKIACGRVQVVTFEWGKIEGRQYGMTIKWEADE